MMTEEEITNRIKTLFPDAILEVSGEDCSFEVYVVSEEFAKKNTLQRQQPILALFNSELASGKLHALSVRAKTPDEQLSQTGLIQLKV